MDGGSHAAVRWERGLVQESQEGENGFHNSFSTEMVATGRF